MTGKATPDRVETLEAEEPDDYVKDSKRLADALAFLLDTVERGDEFRVRERTAAARDALRLHGLLVGS